MKLMSWDQNSWTEIRSQLWLDHRTRLFWLILQLVFFWCFNVGLLMNSWCLKWHRVTNTLVLCSSECGETLNINISNNTNTVINNQFETRRSCCQSGHTSPPHRPGWLGPFRPCELHWTRLQRKNTRFNSLFFSRVRTFEGSRLFGLLQQISDITNSRELIKVFHEVF